jgi:ferric-dicitrate binding protein FerR (iron transport regulator)
VTALGELTASIAHEVNQPLAVTVVNGNASLRWLAANPPNLEETRQAVERIVKDANRRSAPSPPSAWHCRPRPRRRRKRPGSSSRAATTITAIIMAGATTTLWPSPTSTAVIVITTNAMPTAQK